VLLFRAALSAAVFLAFAAVATGASAGSRLGPDGPVLFAQSKGKGGGTPPGQQDQPATPSTPGTDHEPGVHGTRGRDSSGFGSPSGLRGLDPVPQGR